MENFQEIIAILKKQDKTALKSLYEQYGRKFYSYCIYKWHLSEDDAWEVVYKTLQTLILKISNYSFSTQADFNRFIFKVLINFLRQHYRASQARKAKDIQFVDLDGLETDEVVAKHFDAAAIREYYGTESPDSPQLVRLKAALEHLDSVDRDLLLLRAQNYSYEEIAGLLKLEDNQLKVRHHRAKKKLVEMLTALQTI